MTAIKSALTRMSPLPSINPRRSTTPLKSALAALKPILPDIPTSSIPQKNQLKKRVRFALKSDSEEEKPLTPVDQEKPATFIINSAKRVNDPWRMNGPLCGAYTEYLEKKEDSTPDLLDLNQLVTPEPEPEPEPSTYTHTFVIQSKIPEIVVDSITVSTPSRQLPRIVQRTKATKTTVRKSPPPVVVDSYLKQRTPTLSASKRMPHARNTRSPKSKRTDITLPLIKSPNFNEKTVVRTDQPIGTKMVNEYLQSKKLTEIISNPLPNSTPHQISYIYGHTVLPNLSKTPSTSYQNQINNEPNFFQNHTKDHFQQIIHSSH